MFPAFRNAKRLGAPALGPGPKDARVGYLNAEPPARETAVFSRIPECAPDTLRRRPPGQVVTCGCRVS
jgi:hypothetical protein